MEFRILGPLEARSGGRQLPLGGPRQRALLSYLLLHAGEVVSSERLLDELWFDLPQGGAAALQTQVSRLRKLVDDRLATEGHGYVLRLQDDDGFDLSRLRVLLAEGGSAASAADRSRLLREAEELWSGEPLAGIDAPFVAGEAAALHELRVGALEERLAADLERGCAAELIPQIALLVEQEPLRERLRMQQILALYRAGRQADALAAYRAARTILDEELGLEPSPALRDLERAVLQQDPALELVPAAHSEAQPPRRSRRLVLNAAFVLIAVSGSAAAFLIAHSSGGGQPTTRAAPVAPVVPRRIRTTHAVVSHRTRRRKRPVTRHQHVTVMHRTTTAPLVVVHRKTPAPRKQVTTTTVARRRTTPVTTTAPVVRTPATISDNFDGTQIDPTIWYQIATGSGWTLTEKNGYVEFAFGADAQPGGAYNRIGGHLGSQCKFPTDFDARVDFNLPAWPAKNGVVISLWAFLSNVGYAAWRQSSPQWGELVGSYTAPGVAGGVQLADTTGSLRLARKNGVLTAYFLHKGSWDAVTSSHEAGLATVAIGADAGSDFAGQPVVVDLSNFTVTGDDPVCPPGSHPNG